MNRFFKVTAIIIVLFLLVIVLLLKIISTLPAAPRDYQKSVKTAGTLETKYMSNGPYQVSIYEQSVLQGFKKFIIHYPSNLTESLTTFPVIVICNGSGTPLSKYPSVANHFASWGFIVIGTEEDYDRNGFSSEMCIRYLTLLNKNETIGDNDNQNHNIFFGKIDFENIGIVGHSQGGVGVFNSVTTNCNSSIFKAAVSLSPTNLEPAHNLLWDYDATLIDIPIMLISGAGGGDDLVVNGEQLQAIYDDIASDKIMFRRKNTPHNETLYAANGYVTAWFMYYLKGDIDAKNAFVGDHAEILYNPLYQDAATSFNN